MSFLYFIPGTGERPPRAKMIELGLGYALPDEGDVMGLKSSGPDGQVGFLMQPVGEDGFCRFSADEQTWRKGPDGKYWVGFWAASRPGEKVLRRPRFLAGEAVKLRDGAEWTIPIARSLVGGATLPRKPVLLEDCKTWRLDTLPEFMGLCKAAERVLELITTHATAAATGDAAGTDETAATEAMKFDMDYDEAMGIVIQALSVNYRLSAVELSLLELFTDVEIMAVFRALIDFSGFVRMAAAKQKKPPASA